ncbi:heme biosynthesis protein HemY [Hyphococcus sp.]|uniref:heme biosynthesis protein HemY n=1 Tax=Hyphococcus sp. TaxID=2038636 RepID=UPI0020879760|nr:MAG: heme biosynthesis protein HemY [Marinicaulis sp.]
MIRILIFLLGAVFFAFAITYFASLDSRITGEAFGTHFDGPSGLIVGGAFAVLLIAIYLTHKTKDILAIPAKLRAKAAQTKRERGIAALTRGLEAAAAGDGDDATHHARVARRNLEDVALTRLLTAQAAQLTGDKEAAKESFSAMLAAPETEFLGLKGLYAQSLKAGEIETAKGYAERAFRLRPNAQWAFQSVFGLGLERGAWREVRDALAQAQKNKIIDAVSADRARAALLTADAYSASDNAAAASDLDAALKLAPGFTPAAQRAAQLAAGDGKTSKAAKIIEAAFAESSHPALIKLYDRLYKDEPTEKRAEKLRKLAEKNTDADEAALLCARAATLTGDYAGAVDALEVLLARTPSSAAFSLMAKAAAGLNGEAAAQVWLEHAANAPRDPRPGADGEFHLTRDGWARMVRDYMEFARLSPPPIEEAASGLTQEEVRLLLAPPAGKVESAAELAEDAHVVSVEPSKTKPPKPAVKRGSLDEDDHIHDDVEAERAANAAREVS